jgi:hypothetical protein
MAMPVAFFGVERQSDASRFQRPLHGVEVIPDGNTAAFLKCDCCPQL